MDCAGYLVPCANRCGGVVELGQKSNRRSRDLFWPSAALWLGLRVADGLSQHLAKLCLGLRRFPRKGFLPLGHAQLCGDAI
jgi:hypothetical protein